MDPLKNLVDGNYMYVSNEYQASCTKHKHRDLSQWSKIYFYKDRQKTIVPPDTIKVDHEITSSLEYQHNIFYKLSHLSDNDATFDYYYKLKSDVPSILFKPNNRYRVPHNKQGGGKNFTGKPRHNTHMAIYNINSNGQHVVEFN